MKKKQQRFCEVCGRDKEVFFIKKFNKLLCNAHYQQMLRHGKIVKVNINNKWGSVKENEYKIYKDYASLELVYHDTNYSVKIDIEDMNRCKEYIWSMKANYTIQGYRRDKEGNLISCALHRYIMGNPENYSVRHRSSDLLDNRKANLILFPVNKPDIKTSKGVSWNSNLKTWEARVFCGRYKNVEEAEKISEYMRSKLDLYKKEVKKLYF